ncbi:hypothetical protein BKA82DRAFT_144825 [Pisolithus tinctorius]|uniref:Uncharacterized protein n=1 Tax=Pisolithus tinctorius Marx 270 TaxID=870435 RepID=A0A0C3NSN2_PISTI|nr:hypothetical protein BKA82DRAFT_144825 [Pisolithus tinctorius]KIO03845.1 hypothetical protein M404DRAFT_144825 [Pisolithus tinctorius Marx 270]
MALDSFPMFFTVRAITFTCIVFLALVWLILVSVEMFARWNISDTTSQSLMFVLILTNAVTIFIPPVLLILEFRIWLDAARLLLIFVLQTGAAIAFTCWSPQIQCPDQTADDMGVCKLLNAYTVMACWVIPTISLFYIVYFVIVVYMQSRMPDTVDSPIVVPSSAQPSVLPIMDPEMGEKRCSIVRGSSDSGPNTRSRSSQPGPPLLPLVLPQRQLTLPAQSQSASASPQRHRSLPATHHLTGAPAPRRTTTLSIPAPLAPQSQFQPVSRLSSNLQAGIVGSRPPLRHLSMMPPPSKSRSFSSEAASSPITESPTTRSVLSKAGPSYLM